MSRLGRLVALAAILAACSSSKSSGTPSDDGGTTADAGPDGAVTYDFTDACTKFWTAVCTKGRGCQLPIYMDEAASVDECVTRFGTLCKQNLGAPGATVKPDDVTGCIAQSTSSCGAPLRLLLATHPAACGHDTGTRDDGAPCGTDLQCKGGWCERTAASDCGKCAQAAGVGEKCGSTILCKSGLTCVAVQGGAICAAPVDAGGTCDFQHPCYADLACVAGKCATPPAAGTACDPTAFAPCGYEAFNQHCNNTTNKCEGVAEVAANAPCSNLDDGTYAFCSYGAHCKAGTLGQAGTCTATADVGQACTEFNGPQGDACKYGTGCVTGTCKGLVDISTCN
jgi:hypothetical protein